MRPTSKDRAMKVVRMFDSPEEGERVAALEQMVRMAEQGGTSRVDFLKSLFGGDSDNSAMQQQLEEALEDNNRIVERVRELEAQLMQTNREENYGSAVEKIWSYPQTRLGAALAVLAIRIWLVTGIVKPAPYVELGGNGEWFWLQIAVAPVVGKCLWSWIEAEFRCKGAGSVFLKSLVIVAGTFMSMAAFNGGTDIRAWAPNWISSVTNETPALLWLLGVAVLTLTNIFPWITRTLAHSEEGPFQTLRHIFE